MNIEDLKKLELESKLPNSLLLYNEPMNKHTSFRTGGPCDLYAEVKTKEDLILLLTIIKEKNIPFTILGNGSNLLVKDGGLDGIAIKYNNRDIQVDDLNVTAASGVINAYLGNILLEHELSGFEFASGIPGTLGGAIYMNAGAFGSEMKDVITEVEFINLDTLEIEILKNEELDFRYRYSAFQDRINGFIISAKMHFKKSSFLEIEGKINDARGKRISSQPLEFPSAGSTFKRMDGFLTSKAIDEAGLKGYKIGGAQVSEKHAGFIINRGNATSKDIIDLIEYVKKVIYEKYNKEIEAEVRIIGR